MSFRETTFGVELRKDDRCFVCYEESPPREGTITSISEDGFAMVRMDGDGIMELCTEDRVTLSFELVHINERRRLNKHNGGGR